MRTDWHAHYVPGELLRALERRSGYPRVREGFLELHEHFRMPMQMPLLAEDDFGERLRLMDQFGIDVQVLGLTALGLDIPPAGESLELARIYNDGLARVREAAYAERFRPLAAVALKDVPGSIRELELRVREQGFSGVSLHATVDGLPLDSPRFEPFFAKVAELDVPIFLHAGFHRGLLEGVEELESHGEGVLWGTLFHSSVQVAVNRLIASGVFGRHPRLRFVLQSGGVGIPYLLGKYFWKQETPDGQVVTYADIFRRHFYCETSKLTPKALEALIEIVGEERVVFGADFPFGPLEKAVKPIRSIAGGSSLERAMERNDERLLGLGREAGGR